MSRFRFRLERLLSVRRMEERAQARRIAALLSTEAMHQDRVDQSAARRDAAEKQIADLRQSVRSSGIQIGADRLFRALRQQVRREEEALASAEAETEKARAEYVETQKSLRALERLRERRHDRWRRKTLQQEQRVDDDLAASMKDAGAKS